MTSFPMLETIISASVSGVVREYCILSQPDVYSGVRSHRTGVQNVLQGHFTVGFLNLDLSAICVEHGYWQPF